MAKSNELYEMPVEVQRENGAATAPGLAHNSCLGLAVTMSPFGVFTVTHISTGMKMCGHYERASSAILVMSQYAMIAASKNVYWADLNKNECVSLIVEASKNEVPFGSSPVS